MKGVVFREFIDMVENIFGEEMVDDLITATDPASKGAYTSVGTYDHSELLNMVAELSRRTGLGQDVLVHDFGLHLARVFAKKFSGFFDSCEGTFDFLKRIDNHIHVEVKKLYPDAQLPKFTYTEISPYEFELKYESSRDFSHLAHGLIVGCMEHFHESFQIERQDVATSPDIQVIFKLRRFIK